MSSIYSSRALGRSLGAFSAFAGGGRVIWGPFSFAESWSSDDYESASHFNSWVKPYLDQVNRKDLTFEPLSSAVRTRAGAVFKTWKEAADLGNPAASSFVETTKNQMNELIARADGLTLAQSLGKRSIGTEVSRYEAFNEINTVTKRVAASGTKASAALNASSAEQLPIDVPVTSSAQPVQSDITSGGAGVSRTSSALTTSGGLEEESGPSRTMLYLAIGVGAVLLLGGGLFLGRRKKSATAGYRRRKKRRSRR